MKKAFPGMILAVILAVLSACGNQSSGGAAATSPSASPSPAAEAPASSEPASGTRTIKYLDTEYTVPVSAERIVITGAMEAMEDSILLDIHPAGAISVAGKFPPLFASITDKAESIGEKTEPNFEKILSLKPDVILATTKFDAAVLEKLKQIAPTIPYSHVSTNWEANLTLLGELSGKEDKASGLIASYKADLETAKGTLGALSDKKVLLVRIREGAICIYGKDLYFNPVLYGELGLKLPDEIAAAKKQETVSIEKFAQINPDVLFIQFSEDENPEATGALDELQKNPIFQSLNAVKNGKVFVNTVDPLAQGGTAYSKIQFLKAFLEKTKS
ncbi:iron complex transport system substrate-binding protein [Paenibacillus forsythiae]|uniref:Iron complex transport system substrate-binding protein n=1 Tax=Paenibacillus forsythiae TaxID=365616 RepID=A0ABU3H6K0_9BACL|nr:ABC transporter substrate-binding protein [Paenibacillus forsythiae]MDT3426424.1 iron complex transport system substrate-binding protein [Paenibacillus forsythiae]